MSPNPLTAGLRPTHPGELLREDVIPALGHSKVEIARLLGISRCMLYDILDERRPITPQMALRIGKLTGTSPESWLAMQQVHDLSIARRELGAVVAGIPTLKAKAA